MGNIRHIIQRIAKSAQEEGSRARLERGAQILRCTIGDREFGLLAKEIVEVAMVPAIVDLARPLPGVLGIVNIRGTIVPILDIHERLQIAQRREIDDFSRLVILAVEDEPVGFLADRMRPQLIEGLVDDAAGPTDLDGPFEARVTVGEDQLPLLSPDRLVPSAERPVLKELCAQY